MSLAPTFEQGIHFELEVCEGWMPTRRRVSGGQKVKSLRPQLQTPPTPLPCRQRRLLKNLIHSDPNSWSSAGYAADKWRLDAGLRAYGGKPDSAFGLLPERRAAFVTFSVSY